MSEPLTDEKLAEIDARESFEYTMRSGCGDYACYCHFDAKDLVAEVRRLRSDEWLEKAALEIEALDKPDYDGRTRIDWRDVAAILRKHRDGL